jgi:hypothetical protein
MCQSGREDNSMSNPFTGRKHKYHVNSSREERTMDGHVFDSLAEMGRYVELRMMEKAKAIKELVLQPSFVIIPKGPRIKRARKFTPDFSYTEKNRQIIEDVKGFITKDYELRRDLFLSQHPDVDYREIHNGKVKCF